MKKFFKITAIIAFNTFLIFIVCAEFYYHKQIKAYRTGEIKSDKILQRMLLYTDANHFMQQRNYDDLNSDNIRSQIEASEIKAEDTNIIFLGDSFVYGFLLSHHAAIPYQFEEIAQPQFPHQKINGINFGWISSSPLLSNNLLKKIGKKYKPDVVILDLDLGDFYDDLRYDAITNKKSIFTLSEYLPFTTFALELFCQKLSNEHFEKIVGYPKKSLFINERPIEQSTPYIEKYTFNNIDDIYRYTTEVLNAKFILVVNPKTFHYNEKESPNNWLKGEIKRTPHSFEIFDYIKNIAKEKPYPIVSLLPVFQQTTVFPTAFDGDAHWNRDGYKIAATEIVEQCKKLQCFSSVINNEK